MYSPSRNAYAPKAFAGCLAIVVHANEVIA